MTTNQSAILLRINHFQAKISIDVWIQLVKLNFTVISVTTITRSSFIGILFSENVQQKATNHKTVEQFTPTPTNATSHPI